MCTSLQKKRGLKRGFTMVETLVAITILLIAVVVPMRIASQSVKTASLAREQLTAVYLAQEGLEMMIRLRDNDALDGVETWDWFNNLPSQCKILPPQTTAVGCGIESNRRVHDSADIRVCSGTACLLYLDDDSSSGRVYYSHSSSVGAPSPYTRVITVRQVGSTTNKEVQITSRVSWTSAYLNEEIDVVLQTHVFNQYD